MTDDKLREFSGDHLLYELEMLFFASELLLAERFRSLETVHDNIMKNALIESFTIHLRSLTHFLYREPERPDDVVAEHYVGDIQGWRAARGEKPETLKVAEQRTGKEIAHLTTKRHASGTPEKQWSPQELTKAIVAPLKQFRAFVPEERLEWAVRQFLASLET